MRYEELKKQFNSYTKEQIIDALLCVCRTGTYNEAIIRRMQSYINDTILRDENSKIEAAYKKWKEASAKQIEYIDFLKEKYGVTSFGLFYLNDEERAKYIHLNKDEETLYKKLDELQNNQIKRQEKLLKNL